MYTHGRSLPRLLRLLVVPWRLLRLLRWRLVGLLRWRLVGLMRRRLVGLMWWRKLWLLRWRLVGLLRLLRCQWCVPCGVRRYGRHQALQARVWLAARTDCARCADLDIAALLAWGNEGHVWIMHGALSEVA